MIQKFLTLCLIFAATTATAQQVTVSRDIGTLQQQGQINTLKNMVDTLINQNNQLAAQADASITALTNELLNVRNDLTNAETSITVVEQTIISGGGSSPTYADCPSQNMTIGMDRCPLTTGNMLHGQTMTKRVSASRASGTVTYQCLDGTIRIVSGGCSR